MSYRITDDCVACGHCAVVCPEQAVDDGYTTGLSGRLDSPAIWSTAGESPKVSAPGSRFYQITKDCTECGKCLSVCPTTAIISGF